MDVAIAKFVKGPLTVSIATVNPAGDATAGAALDQLKPLPALTSSENGIRNFSDAISQSQ
jgi:hypothetical protein